jgi:hypothetical protein
MALYDYNGRYLMDEELAAMDAKKISEAKGLLEDAHRSLKQAINLANSLKGYAASVYQDKLMSVESVLKEDAGRCEDCARLINNAISNNQGIAEEARRKKNQEAAVVRGPSPTREIAATVTTQNTNKSSMKDKLPEPAAADLLGGLF